MSLDTLANVKTRLGITASSDDSLLALLQDSADSFIKNYCDRDFEGGSFTEYHPGGSEFVHLRNYPVAAVASVNVDASYVFGAATILPATRYAVHVDWGVIQSLAGPLLPHARLGFVNAEVSFWTRGPRVVQVVYSVTAAQVPTDVREASARLIGHWYRRVKTESGAGFANVTRQKFGDIMTVYASDNTGALPEDVRELLAPYRVPHI